MKDVIYVAVVTLTILELTNGATDTGRCDYTLPQCEIAYSNNITAFSLQCFFNEDVTGKHNPKVIAPCASICNPALELKLRLRCDYYSNCRGRGYILVCITENTCTCSW